MKPGLEQVSIPKGRQVLPRVQEGPLRCVLGPVWVAQDPVRERIRAIDRRRGERREGIRVTALRSFDEICLHLGTRAGRPSGCLTQYETGRPQNVQE